MATYRELKLSHRIFMNAYPFSRYAIADNPCAKLAKPLSECKFALVTSAGLRKPDQDPFDHSHKLGDVSFREIPNAVDVQTLVEDHKSSSFDHSGVRADKNLAFPLDSFRALVAQKKIGSLNHRHFSFMGSIINPEKLIGETAPEVAHRLSSDKVDAVFLVPV
jgi:D-proline reductase (dithiol) PrdB